ncbi:MAG: nucleotide exchange factor GrpE [Candidatus Hydrogenedentota bacterium]
MPETAPVIEAALHHPSESSPAVDFGAELAELKDRHLRLQAEFENFRKRKIKEADDIRQYAAVNVMENILPVLDHLSLALDPSHDRTDPQWGQGIDLIARQLFESLKLFGLDEIAVARGDKFEHAVHEAVAEEESADVKPGCITMTIRRGYRVKDRVIRHAHVVVAREKASTEASSSPVPEAPEH